MSDDAITLNEAMECAIYSIYLRHDAITREAPEQKHLSVFVCTCKIAQAYKRMKKFKDWWENL